jgi:hypothetical protein
MLSRSPEMALVIPDAATAAIRDDNLSQVACAKRQAASGREGGTF